MSNVAQKVSKKLLGMKSGMIKMFDQNGAIVACTAILVEPNVICQIKTKEKDGYNAIQLGCGEVKTKDARTIEKRVTKPLIGHFKKAGCAPCRHLVEAHYDDVSSFTLGQKLDVTLFQDVKYVDIAGVSKGKGYQGVMKKYNFKGGPAAHGSGFHRHAGSTGMRTSPGRCLPGGPRPSHMGDENVTIQNLKLVAIDEKNNLLLVEGGVPGAKNGLVVVMEAIKMSQKAEKKSK